MHFFFYNNGIEAKTLNTNRVNSIIRIKCGLECHLQNRLKYGHLELQLIVLCSQTAKCIFTLDCVTRDNHSTSYTIVT